MAQVTVLRSWPDGDELTISVEVDASYPDAVAEARVNAIKAYAAALGITVTEADE